MLLGATAAQSKSNFIAWVDDLISSVATEDCKAYALFGVWNFYQPQFLWIYESAGQTHQITGMDIRHHEMSSSHYT